MTFFGLKLQGQDQENRANHQELPGKPPSTGFLVASRGSAIHVFLVLKKHRGFYEASKQMTNIKAGVESALYYNVRFPKRIYNNTWQKRPFRIGYNYLLKALFFVCLFCCFFLLTYALAIANAIAKVQRTILNSSDSSVQLLEVRFYMTSRRPYLSYFQNRLTRTHPNLLFHWSL